MDKPSGSPPPSAGLGAAPGLAAFTNSLEMMKRMWSLAGMPGGAAGATPPLMPGLGGSIPSMFLPTIDVDELDKRIADLRSVEQWLNLNATMLRTTIQSLEVQRNTLAALQAFGGSMLGSMAAAAAAPPAGARPGDADDAASAAARSRARGRAAGKEEEAAAPAPPPFNPAQWWTSLQDQFMKVAGAALADGAAKPAGPGSKAETRDESKPEPESRPADAGRAKPAERPESGPRATGAGGRKS